ncbi:MAG: 16S rRNA (cytidine(1402)-2'-O)-methyltransferase [Synergistaceae bacterium]|nr:16S rRNA (cytidine(1402)-2'-O)-methyltransferase [Synergistaceae bacterium]
MPLTLIPTPIGNLEDITLRALRALREADVIACEDTRTSSILLKHYDISAPALVPFHLYNENQCLPRLLASLREGKRVAVISDAGTPGISDPGWILLRRALEEGLEVDALPGPSAMLPAVLLSGLAPHPFLFYGFPPEKPGERGKLFESLKPLPYTLCFYVSPHKAERQLEELAATLGDRNAALVREISKVHQEAVRGKLSGLLARLREGLKGEMVLVIEGRSPENETLSATTWQSEADAMRNEGRTAKDITREITSRYPVAKNVVKEYIMRADDAI